jgi:hypothetical protein
MTGVDVRYVGNSTIHIATGEDLRIGEGETLLPRSLIEPLSLAALRRAAREMWERDLRLLDVWIVDLPPNEFDPGKVLIRDIADVRLVAYEELHVVFPTGHTVDDDPAGRSWVPEVLQPLLHRRGARLVSVGVDPADSSDQTIVATIEPPWRGKTVADALRLGDEAVSLVKAMDGRKTRPGDLGRPRSSRLRIGAGGSGRGAVARWQAGSVSARLGQTEARAREGRGVFRQTPPGAVSSSLAHAPSQLPTATSFGRSKTSTWPRSARRVCPR